jgi:hypothetical protein
MAGVDMIHDSDPLSRGVDPGLLYPLHLVKSLNRNAALVEIFRMRDPSVPFVWDHGVSKLSQSLSGAECSSRKRDQWLGVGE